MKKYVIMMAFLTVMAFASIAGGFEFGFKTGYSSTIFNTDNGASVFSGSEHYTFRNAKDEFKGGYLFGVYSKVSLIGSLFLQPELYYSKKSGSTDFNTNEGVVNEKLTYYSWDIPVLAHLQLLDLKVLNVYGLGGLAASFRAGDKSSLSSQFAEHWDGDNLRCTNWKAQLGAGVQVLRFSFDMRYEWGLNDLSASGLDRKSKSLMFSLGYRLFGF
jgi:hypothetical protein